MVFNSNYSTDAMLVPATIMAIAARIEFIPVCGAMRRNHLIKE